MSIHQKKRVYYFIKDSATVDEWEVMRRLTEKKLENVPRLYSVVPSTANKNRVTLTMENTGESLEDIAKRNFEKGETTELDWKRLDRDLRKGVGALSTAGYRHLDLRGGALRNITMRKNGTFYVVDFGKVEVVEPGSVDVTEEVDTIKREVQRLLTRYYTPKPKTDTTAKKPRRRIILN